MISALYLASLLNLYAPNHIVADNVTPVVTPDPAVTQPPAETPAPAMTQPPAMTPPPQPGPSLPSTTSTSTDGTSSSF